MRNRVQLLFAAGILLGLAVFVLLNFSELPKKKSEAALGVTFSTEYAKSLGLDWKQAFTDLLDDVKVRHFRIPVYWDEIERTKGQYDWSDVDWMLSEAHARGADVILVIGRKVPRWPECHVPDWAGKLPEAQQRDQVLGLLDAEVSHFKADPAIRWWQVENEPLFHFGQCPPPDRDFLKREVALVKSLDSRKVMVTDSGELSTWIRTATIGDVLGISMYRLVWNAYVGELYWPVSPLYYTERMNLISPVVKDVIVSELQGEPWFRKAVADTPLDEQFASMDVERLQGNVAYARSTGVSEVYLWGAEWWEWLRVKKDRPEFWQAAKELFMVQ